MVPWIWDVLTGFFKKKEGDREKQILHSILTWKSLIYFGLLAVLSVTPLYIC